MLIYGEISMAIGPLPAAIEINGNLAGTGWAGMGSSMLALYGQRPRHPWCHLGAARVILGLAMRISTVRLLCPPVIRFIKIYPMNRWTFMVSSLKKASKKSMDVWCWSSHQFFGTAMRTGCVLCAGSFGSIFVASDSQVSQVDAPLPLTRHHELPPQSALVLPS